MLEGGGAAVNDNDEMLLRVKENVSELESDVVCLFGTYIIPPDQAALLQGISGEGIVVGITSACLAGATSSLKDKHLHASGEPPNSANGQNIRA